MLGVVVYACGVFTTIGEERVGLVSTAHVSTVKGSAERNGSRRSL